MFRAGSISREDLAHSMDRAILTASQQIRKASLADPHLAGMGTTLTSAAILDSVLLLAHVGDSRAYLFRHESFVQLTEDHSLLQELVSSGDLALEEARGYEHSNVILQALGVTEELAPFGAEIPLARDDLLLLCTDGLTTMVPREEIQEVLLSKGEDLAAMARALTALAKIHGGYDNATVLLARFTGDDLPEADLPADPADKTSRVEVRPLSFPSATAQKRRRPGISLTALVALAVLLMLAVAGVIIFFGMD
jgi:PPM family protein phosphatase